MAGTTQGQPTGNGPAGGPPPGIRPGGPMPSANTAGINNKTLDVPYAATSPAQKLDIYLPNEGTGPFPVIVSIHGGAFKMGDKGDFQVNSALQGLKRGYAVVSINYRLSGEAIFPAQIQDVKAAIRFLRANAKTYKLNPDKLATWGGSAGGHLSAMAGTTGDVTDFDDASLGNVTQSSRVQAVVDWFGPIQFDQMDPQFKVSGKGRTDHDEANSPESELVGKQITKAPELVKRASPATYISKADPPFLIEHGTNDPLVPTQQSILFAAELEKQLGKDKVTYIPIDGAGHGGPMFETPANLDRVFAFLDKYLK
ncbi:alpha/beta hydrolase [Fibrella aquatilis]|uniref:Alpha/beta hydrolase n=1 Tax=Fibrella aquatilis TaxID=2817059 RepID=A0A939G669_9BACT|nr:alpha/beta hydrolase [Fibrella aquatilis]MBO0931334.1 alpha/beta hydrolase [Fibrella aquatilis]